MGLWLPMWMDITENVLDLEKVGRAIACIKSAEESQVLAWQGDS